MVNKIHQWRTKKGALFLIVLFSAFLAFYYYQVSSITSGFRLDLAVAELRKVDRIIVDFSQVSSADLEFQGGQIMSGVRRIRYRIVKSDSRFKTAVNYVVTFQQDDSGFVRIVEIEQTAAFEKNRTVYSAL
jgi:hypothetical protein